MNLLKIWKIADKKPLFILQIVMNIAVALLTVKVSELARKSVDQGVNPTFLIEMIGSFMALMVVGVVVSYSAGRVSSIFSVKLMEKLRNHVTDRLIHCEYSYFEKETTGSISNRMLHDMNQVAEYMSNGFIHFMSQMILLGCSFIYLLTINWSMTLLSAICMPLAVFATKKIATPTYNTMEKFDQKMDSILDIAKDTIDGVKIEKAYNLKKRRKDYFDTNMHEATSYYVAYEKLVVKAGPYKYVIKAAPMFMCILFGFYNAYRGQLTSGELVAFIILLQNVSKPLSELITYITEFKEAMVSVDRVAEMMDLREESFGTEVVEKNDAAYAFELEQVSFKYGQDLPIILDEISLKIPKGKTIALVGQSGCGKSTLFKLLIGFHLATKGQVKLYDKDIKAWNIEEARSKMAYVSQSTYLFEGTVAENIAYGKMGATFEEIVTAAKKAYAHEFIMTLPEGYQSRLSEKGTNLSGGQKQRLAIARAFLKDAPIFILDEMTSALDVESEKLIQKAIENYKENKTVILIAHRLSTIENADEIVVLDQGNIIERGNHKELLASGGRYSQLYHIGEGREQSARAI